MQIIINNAKQLADTGILGYVYPFDGDRSICVMFTLNSVDVDGSANFSPDNARQFADAIVKAADLVDNPPVIEIAY